MTRLHAVVEEVVREVTDAGVAVATLDVIVVGAEYHTGGRLHCKQTVCNLHAVRGVLHGGHAAGREGKGGGGTLERRQRSGLGLGCRRDERNRRVTRHHVSSHRAKPEGEKLKKIKNNDD